MKEELKLYIEENLHSISRAKFGVDFDCCKILSADINSYIENNKDENKFQKMLFDYIDARGLKDSEVYNKVNIDRRLFSKIRSSDNYHPSKETIILLAIALELTEQELEEFLESASYFLPRNNVYDLIIRFCFSKKIYKLNEINTLLNDYNCKLLGY